MPRTLAAKLTALLRPFRSALLPPGEPLSVLLQSGHSGLVVRSQTKDLAIELRHAQSGSPALLCLPAAALADFQGQKATPVVLEPSTADSVRARWDEDGLPQVRTYPTYAPIQTPPFPGEPVRLARAPGSLGQALVGAALTAAGPSSGSVLRRWLLAAQEGELISGDGVQLLVQSGLSFPWREEVLVAALPVEVARKLAASRGLLWGKTEQHVCLRQGPWTFYLPIDHQGAYPAVREILPCASRLGTQVRLRAADAALLMQVLPRLCRSPLQDEPLTLELDGQLRVHYQQPGQNSVCTLALAQSVVLGPPLRLRTALSYLLQALQLGFLELAVSTSEGPLVCQEKRRRYGWMPLSGATPGSGQPSEHRKGPGE